MASEVWCARPSLDEVLAASLRVRDDQGLLRRLRPVEARAGALVRMDGRDLVNVASNDYLGLSTHPALAEAAGVAMRDWGSGSAASRLVSGSLAPHHHLEEAIADWQHTGAAIAFSSGFAAASGTIPALVGPGDLVLFDRLSHACCIDAAKSSGATWRPFHHNDPDHLGHLLRQADSKGAVKRRRILVITESVFSMDGDVAPLAEIVELKEQHGAWLLVDEAHASGLHGASRAGMAERLELSDRIDIHLGTLGKAVGAAGGFIAGSRTLVDWLVNSARSFVFSTAPPPSVASAAAAGIQIIRSSEGASLAEAVWRRIDRLAARMPVPILSPMSAILPWVVGDAKVTLGVAESLMEAGFLAPAIRYPTVPRGTARIRIALSAAHSEEHVEQLAGALKTMAGAVGSRGPTAATMGTSHQP
jgi:glycine C-acetyltransferase/8-amino-7-oxononanoate synthase